MSTTNHEASRKPSGSSSQSRGHSPSTSPNPLQPHRKGSTNMFGVAMAPSSGLKTLNSGWQVWGGGNSSRHPSGSSATSIPESSMSHSLSEGWGSRSASGTWDEMADAQQKDLSSLVRQRQVSAQSAGLPATATGVSKQGQQYNAVLGQNASPVANYDSLQSASLVDSDLSAALRGMAVEEEYQGYRQGSQPSGMTHPATQNVSVRGPQQPLAVHTEATHRPNTRTTLLLRTHTTRIGRPRTHPSTVLLQPSPPHRPLLVYIMDWDTRHCIPML
ncbi:hypothetical protein C8Q74DRAFT_66524 [Fomes fomentarius]|nr:hypothetical protein C8Q74DRAFT_66524 [Fomes fomentarius]